MVNNMDMSKVRNIEFVGIGEDSEADFLKKQVLEILRPKIHDLRERPGTCKANLNYDYTYWFKFTNWFNNNGII